jgi:transcriptional regulator with XRE-family HTH domain
MPASWADREDREISVDEHVRVGIAWQVRVNREERGLKQADLANLMRTGQSAISKLEDADGGDVRLGTLLKAAHAFDCALLVRFVSFSEFAAATYDLRSERLLAPTFESERAPRVSVRLQDANTLEARHVE